MLREICSADYGELFNNRRKDLLDELSVFAIPNTSQTASNEFEEFLKLQAVFTMQREEYIVDGFCCLCPGLKNVESGHEDSAGHKRRLADYVQYRSGVYLQREALRGGTEECAREFERLFSAEFEPTDVLSRASDHKDVLNNEPNDTLPPWYGILRQEEDYIYCLLCKKSSSKSKGRYVGTRNQDIAEHEGSELHAAAVEKYEKAKEENDDVSDWPEYDFEAKKKKLCGNA